MDKLVFLIREVSGLQFNSPASALRNFGEALEKAGINYDKELWYPTLFSNIVWDVSPVWDQTQNAFIKTYWLAGINNSKHIFDTVIEANKVKLERLRNFGWEFNQAEMHSGIDTGIEELKHIVEQAKQRSNITLSTGYSTVTDYLGSNKGTTNATGTYIITDNSFIYYSLVDQKIYMLTNIVFNSLNDIFPWFHSDIVRLAKISYAEPIVHDVYRTYLIIETPNNEIGVPFLADAVNPNIIIDNEYFYSFIDQVAEIINCINENKFTFPVDPISIDRRLRDSVGYYFIISSYMVSTKQEFTDIQYEYMNTLLDKLTTFNLNKDDIISYARTKWII